MILDWNKFTESILAEPKGKYSLILHEAKLLEAPLMDEL